jgi:multisubunit Na+/H+ antiporter MnhC subunit
MQQPPNPYTQYPQQQWPQPQYQHTNYTTPQYQTPQYQVPIQQPIMPQQQMYERPVNKAMKSTAIVIFVIAFALAIFGSAYREFETLGAVLLIIGFVCVCFI